MTITPEERAAKLVEDRGEKWYGYGYGDEIMLHDDTVAEDIAAAIREAVEAERETCKVIASSEAKIHHSANDAYQKGCQTAAMSIAGKIAKRSRSNHTPEAE